ncbi:MAG: dihydroorotate dehydrogenase, partial [bacterium]
MNVETGIPLKRVHLRTPLLTASGTFGFGDEFSAVTDYTPLGGIVTKSLSLKPRAGNPPPRIWETPIGGVLNSIGLANPGVEAFLTEKLEVLPWGVTEIFLSVVGETVEEFVEVVIRLETISGISGYELNLSCPNVKKGGLELGTDREMVKEIVAGCREISDRFIAVKLTPHHPVIAPLAQAAEEAGADALTLTNTLVGMAIDIERRKPVLGSVTGGYSGPPLKPVALAKVWQAAQEVSIPIWASGGIITGADGIEYLLAGASALQLGSILFVDPQAPARIL